MLKRTRSLHLNLTRRSMNSSELITEKNGIYIIRQQMPYPLKENNAYLAESDEGWAVIDIGIDIPQTRELWSEALKIAGITFSSIKKIIITHCHPDHLGAAAWMQRMTGAPVYMSKRDIDLGSAYVFVKGDRYENYKKSIAEAAHLEGFAEDKVERLVLDWCDNVLPYFPEPEHIDVLDENDEITLGGSVYRVKIFSGHTDGQIALWCGGNRTLFSGDIFAENGYLHFADWPHTKNDNPLDGLLSSLDAIDRMSPVLIFPGHGIAIHSYSEIFSRLRRRHKNLLEIIEGAVTDAVMAGEIYQKFFASQLSGGGGDNIHNHRVLLGETRGYLNYLVSHGRLLVKKDNGKILYFQI